MKRVVITPKPKPASVERSTADACVERQSSPVTEPVRLKRLTIDIPYSLHVEVKSKCVLRNVSMVDVVREFLEREFLEREPESVYPRGEGIKPADETRPKPKKKT